MKFSMFFAFIFSVLFVQDCSAYMDVESGGLGMQLIIFAATAVLYLCWVYRKKITGLFKK